MAVVYCHDKLCHVMHVNVNKILFIHNSSDSSHQSILFFCALHFSRIGRKVVYISPSRFDALPPQINNWEPADVNSLQRIRFMYALGKDELIDTLCSFQFQHEPATVLLVEHLEKYCSNLWEASAVSAALDFTGKIIQEQTDQQVLIFSSRQQRKSQDDCFTSSYIHFSIIWSIVSKQEQILLLRKSSLGQKTMGFLFVKTSEGGLYLQKVGIQPLIDLDAIKFDTDLHYC